MRKKTFSLILSGILPITALSFTAFATEEIRQADRLRLLLLPMLSVRLVLPQPKRIQLRLTSGTITATIYQTVLILQERAGIA